MSEDVSDLVIKMRPEGVPETVQGLNTAEEATQETTEAMEGQSEAADGFLQKFQGSMSAAVAGLAVASAGLLSQVPVIGEAMQGLFSVVEAVAFQMDQVLRPILGPIANGFFELSNAIFEMNGPVGKAVGILGTMATVFGVALLGPVGAVGAAIAGLVAGVILLLNELGVLKPIMNAIKEVVGGIVDVFIGATQGTDEFFDALKDLGGTLRNIAESALDKFLDGVKELAGEIKDIVQETDWVQVGKDVLGLIIDGLLLIGEFTIDLGSKLVNKIKETDWVQLGKDVLGLIIDGLEKIGEITVNIGSKIKDTITETDWVQVGKNLLDEIAEGISNAGNLIKDAIREAAGNLKEFLPSSPAKKGPLSDLDQTGPALVETFASGIEGNTARLQSAGSGIAQAASDGLNEGGQTANITNGDSSQVIEVDGRTLGRTTSRKQRSITASRNIDG